MECWEQDWMANIEADITSLPDVTMKFVSVGSASHWAGLKLRILLNTDLLQVAINKWTAL